MSCNAIAYYNIMVYFHVNMSIVGVSIVMNASKLLRSAISRDSG